MGRRVLGLICFCVGFGMFLAMIVPAFGWVFGVAIGLISLGYFMGKEC